MSLVRINRNPSESQLRLFSGAWLAFVGAWAFIAEHRGHPDVARTLVIAALAIGFLGILFPMRVRMLYLCLSYATFPVGYLMSHAILAVLYYCILTPMGLLMRLFRYDPLYRTYNPGAKTYWAPRQQSRAKETYLNQS